jgi:ATP-dependent helicase IRC3
MNQLGLRDYQHRAQHSVANEFWKTDGASRQLGVLPTGTGKTVVFSTLALHPGIEQFFKAFPADQRKILVIAHREELLTQAQEKYEKYNPHLKVEIEQADKWASPEADVIIASIQTLGSRQGRRLGRLKREQIRVVIIDEAHHATAQSYVSVCQYFGFLPPDDFMPKPGKMQVDEALKFQRDRLSAWDSQGKPPRLLLGVTATPKRADRVGLELVFQKIVFEETMLDMIRQGYLARPRGLRIQGKALLDKVHTKGGDFDEGELAEAINNVERNRIIVKAWLEHAQGRKTIAFTVNVQGAIDLAAEFQAAGVKAAAIHGGSKDRKALLKAFSTGEIEMLVNCNILTEGFDEPNVQCIIHARPTKSSVLYTQMTGRGTRLCDGKVDCLIIDVVDITTRHSLVTAPTLIGLPADYDPKGKDLVDQLDKIAELKKANPMLDTSKATSLEDVEMHATEVDLFGLFRFPEATENSNLSWMKIGDAFEVNYIGGPMSTEETLRVKPNDFGSWDVTVSEFNKEYQVAVPTPDSGAAFKQAETWLKENRPLQAPNLDRTQKWRNGKISAGQKGFLEKLLSRTNMPPLDISNLTAGQGADLIDICKQKIKGRI